MVKQRFCIKRLKLANVAKFSAALRLQALAFCQLNQRATFYRQLYADLQKTELAQAVC